jgi:hypothetical protein
MPTRDPRLKAMIRAELFRCAAAGMFPTYEQFRHLIERRVHNKGRFPWKAYFEEIAAEERGLGYPDITFIVREKNNLRIQRSLTDSPHTASRVLFN